MKKDEQMMLLARLNAAWPLSNWRAVNVEEADTLQWKVTYQHRETGAKQAHGVYKSELARAEANLRMRMRRSCAPDSLQKEQEADVSVPFLRRPVKGISE